MRRGRFGWYAKVPPASVSPLFVPSADVLVAINVPLLTVVPPENVFGMVSVQTPDPVLVNHVAGADDAGDRAVLWLAKGQVFAAFVMFPALESVMFRRLAITLVLPPSVTRPA